MLRQLALISLLTCLLTACSTPDKKDEYDKLSAADIFLKGRHNLEKERYTEAVEDFDALEARYPYGEYADKAQLAVIYSYYQAEEPESALAATERFIQIHPRHEHVDYAYYMRGLIKFSESLTAFDRYLPLTPGERDITGAKEAFLHFEELVQRFPDSRYNNDARQRMVFLKNVLAEHEIFVAQHYLDRKIYLAALNRATHVVTEFSDTPSNIEALKIMIEAYDAMELTDLAQDTRKVLELNQG